MDENNGCSQDDVHRGPSNFVSGQGATRRLSMKNNFEIF
jgi:hypothetical protein